MTNSVDMCGDGSSRHSVGTHGMTPPVCYGRIKGGVYNEEARSGSIFALVLCLAMVPISAFAAGKTAIRTVDDLLQFAKAVDNGEYDDETDAVVSLEEDLDLADIAWTPIGSVFAADGTLLHYFSGKFYGNGHTISNLDFPKTMERQSIRLSDFSVRFTALKFPV